MRIGELSKRTGVPIETIRFYETKGVMPEAARNTDNNYRTYTEEHLARLHLIRHCRQLDLSLDDIAKLLRVISEPPESYDQVHAIITERIADIDRRIADLQSLRQNLQTLQNHCHGEHSGATCGIVENLQSYDSQSDTCCQHWKTGKHDKVSHHQTHDKS